LVTAVLERLRDAQDGHDLDTIVAYVICRTAASKP
jgi:hypothetical protein